MTDRSRMKGVSEQCINLLSGLYLLTGRQPERETPDMGGTAGTGIRSFEKVRAFEGKNRLLEGLSIWEENDTVSCRGLIRLYARFARPEKLLSSSRRS